MRRFAAGLHPASTHLKADAHKHKYDLAQVALKPQQSLAALDAAVIGGRRMAKRP